MKPDKIVTLGAVAVVGVGLAFLLARPRRPPAPEPVIPPVAAPPSAPAAVAPPVPSPAAPLSGAEVGVPASTAAAPAVPAPAVPARPAAVAAAAASDVPATEQALMTKLRDLSGTNPGLSLKLARIGNERYRGSADAAERGWFIVRSLSDLKRGDEARDEARALVAKYPDSRWATDVHRHMLLHPPTHPQERGFGKKLEGE